jgi:hypothetical protein
LPSATPPPAEADPLDRSTLSKGVPEFPSGTPFFSPESPKSGQKSDLASLNIWPFEVISDHTGNGIAYSTSHPRNCGVFAKISLNNHYILCILKSSQQDMVLLPNS